MIFVGFVGLGLVFVGFSFIFVGFVGFPLPEPIENLLNSRPRPGLDLSRNQPKPTRMNEKQTKVHAELHYIQLTIDTRKSKQNLRKTIGSGPQNVLLTLPLPCPPTHSCILVGCAPQTPPKGAPRRFAPAVGPGS